MISRTTSIGRCVAGLLTLLTTVAAAQTKSVPNSGEWNQFLGPDRNGISREKNLLDHWPPGGPKEVWRAAGGVGLSGISISRGRAITLVQKDGQQLVAAFDSPQGKSLWQTPLAPEYKNAQGDGPRATPTISGETVFVFTGEGILAALNFSDGRLQWSHNVVKDLGGEIADYGMASSPLVVGELVIVIAGAPHACVVAYDRKSGQIAWKTADGPAGYSSPTLLDVGGRRQIVAFVGDAVVGLAPESGESLWRYPYATDYNCNTATPIAIDGGVLISSGENHGSVLLKLRPDGKNFRVEEAWSSQGAVSVLRSEWQTPILLNGLLYGLDNHGSAGPVTDLACLNAKTGERVWQQPRFGKSNLIAADGKLFCSTLAGELVVLRAASKGYEELGRASVLGKTRQAPAIADGLLYMRDDREVVCLDVRKP
jgi:outer membrane protein assembly factor BamB